MKNPTQEEIAQALGVSRATVSRVLRNVTGPRSKTSVRILEMARKMGYRLPATPTSNSRKGAGRQKSLTLGILLCTPDESSSYTTEVPMRILHGATDAARQHSALLHVEYISESEIASMHTRQDLPSSLRSPQVAGILLVGQVPSRTAEAIASIKSCVRMHTHDAGMRMDCIGQDDSSATREMVRYLKKQGHKNIGYYCKRPLASFSLSRFAGYVEALAFEELPCNPSHTVNIWNKAADGGFQEVLNGIEGGVTAWICAHDKWGYELERKLRETGLSVPEDVSVCGFDHLHQLAGDVPLMSIEWPFEDMASAGIEVLVRRINEPMRATSQLLFGGQLVEGISVGPCK